MHCGRAASWKKSGAHCLGPFLLPRPTHQPLTLYWIVFLKVKDDFKKEIFIMIAWSIWNRRNALKFGRPAIAVASIIPSASALLQEFVSAQESLDEPPSVAIPSSGIFRSSHTT